jgi:hypothetical protein
MRNLRLVGAMVVTVGLLAAAGIHGVATDEKVTYSELLASMNASLRARGGPPVAVAKAELLVSAAGADRATTLIANDRTLVIDTQFVEDDERRGSPLDTITYLVDQSDGTALTLLAPPPPVVVGVLPNAVTEAELDASMAVWGAMNCPGPAMQKIVDDGSDPDLVDGLVFGNPALIGTPRADITHAGWLPAPFFNALAPQGASFILGVTFTFVFIDEAGDPTDIDGDRRADVAFREIYYNRSFPWGTGGTDYNVDIQSVAIHEAGHALGLGHFGKIFLKADDSLQFAPKAIMNAAYVSEDRTIRGTDTAAFCQAWAPRY